MIKIGTALFEACEELERERGISKDVLIASLCDAMAAAYKKHMHVKEAANIEAILDEQTGEIHIADIKTPDELVVEFQHSAISPTDRVAREQFYENMIWVVDGSINKNNYKRFVKMYQKMSFKFKKDMEIPFSLYSLSDSDFFNQNWLPDKIPVFFDFRNIQDENMRKITYFHENIWGVFRRYRQLVVIEMEFNYFVKCIEKNVILDILNTSCDLLKK